MSKSAVTRLFVGGFVSVAAGIVLAIVAVWIAFANGVFVMDGPDVVGVDGNGFAWSMVGVALLAALAIVGGAIAGLVSWIGALINTAQLPDKTWFVLLLVLGLLSFGFIAMLVYVIGGPDSTRPAIGRTTPTFVPTA
jgi:hypothetical protein